MLAARATQRGERNRRSRRFLGAVVVGAVTPAGEVVEVSTALDEPNPTGTGGLARIDPATFQFAEIPLVSSFLSSTSYEVHLDGTFGTLVP